MRTKRYCENCGKLYLPECYGVYYFCDECKKRVEA